MFIERSFPNALKLFGESRPASGGNLGSLRKMGGTVAELLRRVTRSLQNDRPESGPAMEDAR
jgi:hypothetical protein